MDLTALKIFARWDVLIFAVLLIIFSILYLKKGFMRNFLSQTRMEKDTEKNRITFMMLSFTISLTLVFLYDFLGIFFKNFNQEMRIAILVVIAIVYLISVMFFLIVSSQNLYDKEIFVFSFFLILVFFLSKNLNNKWGGLLTIILGFSFILIPSYIKKGWKNKNLYPLITILVMLLVLLSGVVIIDGLYGDRNKEIELFLNIDGDVNNRYFGDGVINCKNLYTDIFVGATLICKITPDSVINSSNMTLISLIGEKETIILGQNLSFIIPYEISRIDFELDLVKDNESYHVTTSNQYNDIFTSYELDRKRNQNFVTYLLILLGIIFFSIPPAIRNFKEMGN